MKKNFLNLDNLDLPIYRIFSYERFINLIKSKENGLVRPRKWEDPFENFFLKCNFIDTSTGDEVDISKISDSWYGQCWSMKEESDAMWRIYSPEKNGIKIKTTIRKLFESFYDNKDRFASLKYYIGAVQYKKRLEIENSLKGESFMNLALGGQGYNFARTLLTKRTEFDHENEVRLLYFDTDDTYINNDYVNFHFPWDNLIEEIVLDPRLDEAEVDKLTKAINIVLGTSRIKTYQSELYKVTFPSLPL